MTAGPIVVATDFSARSDRAVDRAILLAEQLSRPLKVIHATELSENSQADRKRLERQLRELVRDADCEVDLLCPSGTVPEAIIGAVRESGASLLVMGVARYNSVGDYFLGTAVDHVLRYSEIPTLVVKRRASGPYRRVLVGTDFSEASRQVLDQAQALLPEADFHAVHAYHVPFDGWQKAEYIRDELREHVDSEMAKFTRDHDHLEGETVEGETGRVIARALERHDCQLIAIGSHGHSGFRQALLGSTTSDLLRELDADVLVFPPAKDA